MSQLRHPIDLRTRRFFVGESEGGKKENKLTTSAAGRSNASASYEITAAGLEFRFCAVLGKQRFEVFQTGV